VAVDDDVEPGGLWFQIERGEIVEYIDRGATEFDNFGLCQPSRPRCLVNVAADRGNGRNLGQLLQDFRITDVAGVDDLLRPAESCERFRTKQSVRVGDDADDDGRLNSGTSPSASNSSVGSSRHTKALLPMPNTCRVSSVRAPGVAASQAQPAWGPTPN
jgi:hypothetical protein